jgi:hypothetical protein
MVEDTSGSTQHKLDGNTWNVIILFISICLTILCIEGGMRICNTKVPWVRTYVDERTNRNSKNFIPDEQVGWRMRPNHSFQWRTEDVTVTFTGDDNGFRDRTDRDIAIEPARRIVILGDSYMWGTGVPFTETCGYRLESAIANTAVHNMAMPGFGMDQIWLSLRHWALPTKPDLVIVGIYMENFSRSQYAYRDREGFNKPTFKLEEGRLVQMTSKDRPSKPVGFLEHHSYLYRFWGRVDKWMGRKYGRGSWWALNSAFLDAIRDDCAATGTPVIFIYIPYVSGITFPALNRYMEEHGAYYIDMSQLTPAQLKEFYFPVDGHLNARGHEYMTEILVEKIRRDLPHPHFFHPST